MSENKVTFRVRRIADKIYSLAKTIEADADHFDYDPQQLVERTLEKLTRFPG